MYIVYRLRHALEQHRVKDIDLAETISINWNTTEYDDSVEPLLFRDYSFVFCFSIIHFVSSINYLHIEN